jgi:tetratricopeptide (TPR) repeat protein
LKRRGEAAALSALALLLLALNLTPITNNDLFLHLKTGELVLETHAVPKTDDYSALARGRPYVAHEWLAGVVFRLVQGALGFDGLILFKVLVAIGVAALLYAAARRLGASPAAAVSCLAFVMILAASRFMERPHIFTYLMTAAFLWLLARRRAGARAPLGAFVPLQVLWANLHGGFILGPAIVLAAALASFLDGALGLHPAGTESGGRPRRREAFTLAVLSAALVAASLVNPYGAGLLRFPFQLTGSAFMEEIYEWLPPFGSPFASTYMARYYVAWIAFGGAWLLLSLFFWRSRRLVPPGGSFPALVFALFLVLSLRMNRNVADFALATMPGVAAAFGPVAACLTGRGSAPAGRAGGGRAAPAARFPARRRAAPLPWIAAILAGLALWFAVNGYAYGPSSFRRMGLGLGRSIPVAAADYLEAIGMRGSVFNTYSAGAYLVYRLHPAVRVAMDSRNDVYGEELYRQYTRALADSDALDALVRRLDAGAILLEWPGQGMMTAAAAVHRLKEWVPAYFDDVAVIYLRADGPWAQAAARDGYSLLDPALYRGGTIRRELAARALQETERALRQQRSYMARVMRIDALLGVGRDGEALEEERRILAEDPPLFHIYTHLGWIRLAHGERAEAAERFRRALHYQPGSQLARQGLAVALAPANP